MNQPLEPAHSTRIQSDSSSSMSIRSETRLPDVTQSHLVFISFRASVDTGSCSYHGAGIPNGVIDTSFPILVVLTVWPVHTSRSSAWAVLLNRSLLKRSDDQEGRSYLSGIPSRSAAPS